MTASNVQLGCRINSDEDVYISHPIILFKKGKNNNCTNFFFHFLLKKGKIIFYFHADVWKIYIILIIIRSTKLCAQSRLWPVGSML